MRSVVGASPAGRASLLRVDHRRPRPSSSSSSKSPTSSSSLLLLRPRPRNPRLHRRSPRLPRTSEFWYEDEEEFDAIAGSLRRKIFYIFGGNGGGGGENEKETTEAAAGQLSDVSFDACFYGQAGDDASNETTGCCVASALSVLWPASRSGAPYFLKPRRRPALDELSRAKDDEASAAAADAAWAEMSSQNWRVELAYGLGTRGGRKEDEVLLDPERPESILVVVAPREAAKALAEAAGASTSDRRSFAVVTLREWEAGLENAEATAPGWRELME